LLDPEYINKLTKQFDILSHIFIFFMGGTRPQALLWPATIWTMVNGPWSCYIEIRYLFKNAILRSSMWAFKLSGSDTIIKSGFQVGPELS